MPVFSEILGMRVFVDFLKVQFKKMIESIAKLPIVSEQFSANRMFQNKLFTNVLIANYV